MNCRPCHCVCIVATEEVVNIWFTIMESVSAVKVTALVCAIVPMNRLSLKRCTGPEELGAGGQSALKVAPKPRRWQCHPNGSVIHLVCKVTAA